MNVLALLRPTRGVTPTLAPGGKTGSAANAEENAPELAATIRATVAQYRSSFMEVYRVCMGPFSGPTMQLGISRVIFKPCGHDNGRSSRPAFSGFDVPATGQGGRPFHRYGPIWRPFCRILPGIRALFEALPAAKYRSPFHGGRGAIDREGCRMAARHSGGAGKSGLRSAVLPIS